MSPLSPLPHTPRVLAIAGGSCSGKTTLAVYLRDYIGAAHCCVLRQDDYYYDIRERGGSPLVNFDIPEALDFGLLRENLLSLKNGEATALPSYDFTTHQRRIPTEPRAPKSLIIVEGILLLGQPALRDIFDHSVYIDCGEDLRLARRLERDIAERGRTREDVLRQFHQQVEPAQKQYVSPSQIHADMVITQSDYVSNITGVAQAITAMIKA